MNQYLLLRDNKQSGPYSVEELVAKGLKPYDLVWLEGKSAAWRYPSELEDLKPYAPAVEEQPYDRFYKKPVAEGAHETNAGAAGGNAGSTVQTLVQEAVLHRVQQQHENEQRQQGYEQQQRTAHATNVSTTVSSKQDEDDVNAVSATVASRQGDSAINDISATVTSRKDGMLETGTPTTVASTNNILSSSDTIPTSNGSIGDASANEAPIQHTISSNKIHVILPAGNHTLVVKNNEQPVNDDPKTAASPTALPNEDTLPGNEYGSIGKKEVDHREAEKIDGTTGKKIAAHVSQPVAKEKFIPEEKQKETAASNKNVFANHTHQSSQQQSNQQQSNHQQSGSLSLEEAIKVVMANAKDLHAGSSGNTSASFNNTSAYNTSASSNNTNAESKNTVAAANTWEEEPPPLQEQLRIAGNRRSKPNNYKMLLRGTIAACLVLGGIIIGLVINRQPSHQTDQATLDQLVSQLQEKEKRQQANNAASLMDQPAENTDLPDNSTNTTGTSNEDLTEDPSYAAVTPPMQVPSVPADKEKQLTNKPDLSGSQPVQEPEMKIVPAVVTNKKEENNNRNSPNANYARENIDKLVSVEASDFKTGVLGGISGLQLTVVNGSLFAMDQVEVQVNFLGPEKRVVKTQTIVFNDLGAGIQKTLEVPKTNRGVSINYLIKRIQSKELGIAHAGF